MAGAVVITNPTGANSHPDGTPTFAEGTKYGSALFVELEWVTTISSATVVGRGVVVDYSGGVGKAALATAADTAIGVLMETPAAVGDIVRVAVGGVVVAEAGGAIAAGQWVTNLITTGKFDDATGGAAVNIAKVLTGVALTAATNDGDEFLMLVSPSR